jgi:hypothetical protein
MANSDDKVTEIDSADDLFLPEVEEDTSSTAMDEDEVSAGDAGEEREEEKQKEPEPGSLIYYGIPAVGVLLILSLGWSFAFIARRGLIPPVKTKLANSKMLKKRAPVFGAFGRMEEKLAKDVTVPISHPFFIPLEGGSAGAKGGKKTRPTVFLNLSVNLLMSSKAAATEFNAKRSQIRQEIFLHYNRLTPKDLETAESRERIRRELIAKIDKKIVQGEVKSILFQEFFTR